MISQEQLIRNFSVMENGEVDFFLGAGASVNSGIPTGGDLIWFFKREIYCIENHVSTEKFKDLKLPSTQKFLQGYFDKKGGYPPKYASNEYSFYFQECYNSCIARKRFIESKVTRHNPSLGYLCLADMMIKNKVKRVWTTNFDALTETAVNIINPQQELLVCSSTNSNSIKNFNPTYPGVCKLHGDFRYDNLQNTEDELQKLESTLQEYWLHCLTNRGMIVIGYSGNDESIMSFFEKHIAEPNFISKGLYWTTLKGVPVSKRVSALIESAKSGGKIADIVEISKFDSLLYSIYKSLGFSNQLIEEKSADIEASSELLFSGNRIKEFIKLNAFKADSIPQCNCFKTDIISWSELKSIINPHKCIASLYNGQIYSFESSERLISTFGNHIKSYITLTFPEERLLKKSDSVYTGMLYDLIKSSMRNRGFQCCKRNKYYDAKTRKTDSGYAVFDAIEMAIEYSAGEFHLFLLPSIHILKENGDQVSNNEYKIQSNRILSRIYNQQYNEKLRIWQNVLSNKGTISFTNGFFELKFISIPLSSGGANRKKEWIELKAYTYSEPIMCFSDTDMSHTSTNQLLGISQYGPLDCSYINDYRLQRPIQLALFSPTEHLAKIIGHLKKLNNSFKSNGKDKFLQDYAGFENVYRKKLLIPNENDPNLCITYSTKATERLTIQDFSAFIKRGIDRAAKNAMNFDVIVIYIPTSFARFRESPDSSDDYNLHDAIKLYAADKGISVQFIEERSTNSYDPCKVLWGLSTSLYAKSQGILWHPRSISDDTAYIGIGYAKSEKQGICIGCSQLFDSTGTGIRMILRKIKNPCFFEKSNPYMDRNEVREMMIELRESYYHCCPTAKLNRVVIHKTTPFMKEEIIGITQAFEGVDVELLQIQEHSPWRAIRFGMQATRQAENFAIKRGTVIPTNKDSFLIWTHGSLNIPEWTGSYNYFKGGRGIPAPLVVKRFGGQSEGGVLAEEILMLTKMNWNSGDSLYKSLPVTLDFAKVLSRMSKQNEVLFDKSYDFRYFM